MKILSPAKINLFLQVIGKRPDEYHELFSLMCCVDLYDSLVFQFGGKTVEIESDDPNIPLDDSNLAHKAASLFFKTLNVNEGVRITIEKSIPVAAGLGGGSSNAASVLWALNQRYGSPFTQDQLLSIGLGLGADVPFFLYRRPAFATGIGEILEAYPGKLPYHILLVYPGVKVSTAEVFRNLNLGLTKCKKKFTKPPLKKFGFDAAQHLCNDLEAVTASKYPVINSIKKQLITCGALGALMSGSGPTVFGLFSRLRKAEKARKVVGAKFDCNAYLTEIICETHPAID